MKFKNHFNYTPTDGEDHTEPSLTIQNQTISIAQMLKRIQGGILPEGNSLEYPEDENETQMRFNDLSQIDEVRAEMHRLNVAKKARRKAAENPPPPPIVETTKDDEQDV